MADNDSTFDADTFLSTSVEQAMETRYTTIPDGDYLGFISSLSARKVKGNDGQSTVVLDIDYLINDPPLAEKLGLKEIKVRQGLFLDMSPDGSLLFGPNKNVRLGRLREALKQNQPGKPWNFGMLNGAGPLKLTVETQPDKTDPTVKYNRVTKVVAA